MWRPNFALSKCIQRVQPIHFGLWSKWLAASPNWGQESSCNRCHHPGLMSTGADKPNGACSQHCGCAHGLSGHSKFLPWFFNFYSCLSLHYTGWHSLASAFMSKNWRTAFLFISCLFTCVLLFCLCLSSCSWYCTSTMAASSRCLLVLWLFLKLAQAH